jgi:hypothetical protein
MPNNAKERQPHTLPAEKALLSGYFSIGNSTCEMIDIQNKTAII